MSLPFDRSRNGSRYGHSRFFLVFNASFRFVTKYDYVTQTESGVSIGDGVLSINPELHEGQQRKHVPGHNNDDPSRSPIADGVNPGELVAGAAEGEYEQVGQGARGDPIFDFGKTIETDANSGKPTQYGTIHSGKKGSHVVPANPDKVGEQIEQQEQGQDKEDDEKDTR